jgi:hypothetical protein
LGSLSRAKQAFPFATMEIFIKNILTFLVSFALGCAASYLFFGEILILPVVIGSAFPVFFAKFKSKPAD